jgi:hypothetical protein
MNPSEPVPYSPLSAAEMRNIFYGLMLGMFLSALNQTIVVTALPTIGREFGDFENCPGSSLPICCRRPWCRRSTASSPTSTAAAS